MAVTNNDQVTNQLKLLKAKMSNRDTWQQGAQVDGYPHTQPTKPTQSPLYPKSDYDFYKQQMVSSSQPKIADPRALNFQQLQQYKQQLPVQPIQKNDPYLGQNLGMNAINRLNYYDQLKNDDVYRKQNVPSYYEQQQNRRMQQQPIQQPKYQQIDDYLKQPSFGYQQKYDYTNNYGLNNNPNQYLQWSNNNTNSIYNNNLNRNGMQKMDAYNYQYQYQQQTNQQSNNQYNNNNNTQSLSPYKQQPQSYKISQHNSQPLLENRERDRKYENPQDTKPIRSKFNPIDELPAVAKKNAANPIPEADSDADLIECPEGCGRSFKGDVLDKHVKVCKKVFQSKRKEFNSKAHRQVNQEQVKLEKMGQVKDKMIEKKKQMSQAQNGEPKWKKQSEAFRQMINAAKQGETVQMPVDDDLIECPTCGRKFNEQAAERHIPGCKKRNFKK